MPLRLTFALASLLLLLPACGGGDPYEELATEQMDLQEQMIGVLTKITDTESAEKHKGDLQDITKQIQELNKKAEAMEQPSEEVENALKQKMSAKMAPLMEAYTKQFGRLMSDPQIMEILEPVMSGE